MPGWIAPAMRVRIVASARGSPPARPISSTAKRSAADSTSLINAAPEVREEALPFLRTMFTGIFGLMMFFMLSGAFRAAGDPRTPLRLGLAMTVLTICFNIVLIPMFGTVGAAFGTIASSTLVAVYGIWRLTRPDSVIHFERGMS